MSGDHILHLHQGAITTRDAWCAVVQAQYGSTVDVYDYQGDPYRFGYIAVSFFVFNFCLWLHHAALEQGVSRLFFVSRDGKLFYDAYQRMFPSSPIEVKYLYCSRKALDYVALYDEVDIENAVYSIKHIHELSLFQVIEQITSLDLQLVLLMQPQHAAGLAPEQKMKSHQAALQLLMRFSDQILAQSQIDRDAYLQYLQQAGVDRPYAAIVDIGYECTAQKRLSELLKVSLHGFYVATFKEALKKIHSPHRSSSFLFNYQDRKLDTFGVVSYVALYETIFSDVTGSFLKIKNSEQGLQPVFYHSPIDQPRAAFVRSISAGCVEAISTMTEIVNTALCTVHAARPDEAVDLLYQFFRQPRHKADVQMLRGVYFAYGAFHRSDSYIVADTTASTAAYSVWIEGEALLKSSDVFFYRVLQQSSQYAERTLMRLALADKFKRKYCKNRPLFFRDSKSALFRAYYRYVGARF